MKQIKEHAESLNEKSGGAVERGFDIARGDLIENVATGGVDVAAHAASQAGAASTAAAMAQMKAALSALFAGMEIVEYVGLAGCAGKVFSGKAVVQDGDMLAIQSNRNQITIHDISRFYSKPTEMPPTGTPVRVEYDQSGKGSLTSGFSREFSLGR